MLATIFDSWAINETMAPTDIARRAPIVVLVEDDAAVLNALTFSFEIQGYEVIAFHNAEALLSTPPLQCACFILDLRLPGMSGLELHQQLRSNGQAAPTILITTHPSEATRARAAAEGIQIVEKPLLEEALAGAVRAAIEQRK